MDLLIRDYRPNDLESCRGLWRQLTQRHRDIYEDESIGGDDPGRQFDQYLAGENLVGPWVAVLGGDVVGMTGLLLDGGDAEIEPVVVADTMRSRGIGSELLEHVKREARARDVDFLSIKPVARNVEAISRFFRSGFTHLGHLDMFLRLDDDSARSWLDGVDIHGHPFRY